MDYFQGVVNDFLRAKRSTFLNTEYMIQLDPGKLDVKDRHWYCDVVAVDHVDRTVQLCEVTYSKSQHPLIKRLQLWSSNWPSLVSAIKRDSGLEGDWSFKAHLFVPQEYKAALIGKVKLIKLLECEGDRMPLPEITALENVLPWRYRSWNGEHYQIDSSATKVSD
jgi:hypothetical protein